jgi:integrase
MAVSRRKRRTAPTYLYFDRVRKAWYLRFRYVDSLGRVHWPRERSPWPRAYRQSLAWASNRRLEIIREFEEELRRLDAERTAGPALGAIMDAYAVDARERGTRWEGSEAYRADVLLETLGRETPIDQVTRGRIMAWRSALRVERARPDKRGYNITTENRKPLSNRSLNAYVTLLQAALNHAVELGMIAANPLARMKRLPEARRTPPALSERQVAALFEALLEWQAQQAAAGRGRRARVPLATRLFLGYFTGGRPEALDALRWHQVDFRSRMLRYGSKGHRDIVVPLDPALLDHLRALRAERQPRPEDLILASPDTGRPVVEWRRQWGDLVRLANARVAPAEVIPGGVAIHALRHSRITHLLLAGTPAQVVAQIAGTSLAMLQRHYAHLMARSLADELARARRHRALQLVGRAAGGQSRGQTRRPKSPRMAARAKAGETGKPN